MRWPHMTPQLGQEVLAKEITSTVENTSAPENMVCQRVLVERLHFWTVVLPAWGETFLASHVPQQTRHMSGRITQDKCASCLHWQLCLPKWHHLPWIIQNLPLSCICLLVSGRRSERVYCLFVNCCQNNCNCLRMETQPHVTSYLFHITTFSPKGMSPRDTLANRYCPCLTMMYMCFTTSWFKLCSHMWNWYNCRKLELQLSYPEEWRHVKVIIKHKFRDRLMNWISNLEALHIDSQI